MKIFVQNFSAKLCVLLLLISITTFAQTGSLRGRVTHIDNGEGIPFVNVVLKGTTIGVATDDNGDFFIRRIPAGPYTIIVSAVGHVKKEFDVNIVENTTTELNVVLENATVEVGEVYVYGASKRRERITESPASISVIDMEEIKRNSGSGQIGKLLEHEPGIDVAQSSLFDFNINSRGFNSSLNRRLLILLDGRDLGTAFLGATEWNGLSIPLEDLGRIEVVRGPGSALYGANAFNGVVNISSITPRTNPGTRITVGGGEMNAIRGDVSHSAVAGRWSYRVVLGGYQGKSFSKDRRDRNFEYAGLNPFLNNEVYPLNTDPVRTLYGSARIDYDLLSDRILTVEGGVSQVENEVIVTGIGRVQVQKATRPWGRINYNGGGLNILLWTNIRHNVEPEKSLSTGLDLIQNASITHGEVQYSFSPIPNKLTIIGGVSQRFTSINTEKTLMLEARDDNSTGIFAQVEYNIFSDLKAVGAARVDRSTIHATQFSPKVALVYNVFPNHSIRATFNKAFQPPNYSEQYLYVFHPISPIAYIGNNNLEPEKITGYEIGYKGVFYSSLFITVDGYFNTLRNFVTDLGPGLNPKYPDPVYFPPPDDKTRTIWSYTNAGKVEEAGYEISANYYASDMWVFNGNFSYFTFKVVEKHPNDVLLPNSPKYKMNGGVTYNHPSGHSVSLNVKYVPSFPWAAGIFRGADIPSYTMIDLSGTFRYNENISLNINVSNLLDDNHYEILGGSLLGRRALASLIISL